jgi:hypothetical protein
LSGGIEPGFFLRLQGQSDRHKADPSIRSEQIVPISDDLLKSILDPTHRDGAAMNGAPIERVEGWDDSIGPVEGEA